MCAITDDGYTIRDMRSSGFDVRDDEVALWVDGILRSQGVEREGENLRINSDLSNLPLRINSMIRAMKMIDGGVQTRTMSSVGSDINNH